MLEARRNRPRLLHFLLLTAGLDSLESRGRGCPACYFVPFAPAAEEEVGGRGGWSAAFVKVPGSVTSMFFYFSRRKICRLTIPFRSFQDPHLLVMAAGGGSWWGSGGYLIVAPEDRASW